MNDKRYCGPYCPHFDAGDGAGTRKCKRNLWDETKNHLKPRLNEELRVYRTCGRAA